MLKFIRKTSISIRSFIRLYLFVCSLKGHNRFPPILVNYHPRNPPPAPPPRINCPMANFAMSHLPLLDSRINKTEAAIKKAIFGFPIGRTLILASAWNHTMQTNTTPIPVFADSPLMNKAPPAKTQAQWLCAACIITSLRRPYAGAGGDTIRFLH